MGLEFVELVLDVEKEFEISIPDREAEQMVTVGQLHAVVMNLLAQKPTPQMNSDDVWKKLRAIVSRQMALPEEEIFRESRFIHDLGMD